MTATYEVTTTAVTARSISLREHTWTVEASSVDDACYQARMNHLAMVRWNDQSIACSVKGWCRNIQSGQWVADHGQGGVLR